MKKLLLNVTIFVTSMSFGQSIFVPDGFTSTGIGTSTVNGKVGIGISNPNATLQVDGDINSTGSNQRIGFDTTDNFTNPSGTGTIAFYGMSLSKDTQNNPMVSHSGFFGINFYTFGYERMKITDTGNVGIGCNPNATLQVDGDISSSGSNQRIGFNTSDKFITTSTNSSRTIAHYGMSLSRNIANYPVVSHSGYFGINFYTSGTERMSIAENGYVGIGSLIPDEKLTVKGKIHAEEVKIDLLVPADYVFQKYYTGASDLKSDYVMPSLAEVEKYTKENKHLPNVPSAQEIKEKGLKLGEMSNVLLQKIEELTLYVIEQNKKIEALEAKVNGK